MAKSEIDTEFLERLRRLVFEAIGAPTKLHSSSLSIPYDRFPHPHGVRDALGDCQCPLADIIRQFEDVDGKF
jgi:hypothetical protein